MNLVRQPIDSNLCGQACVATVTGVDLEDAITAVGTRGKTNTAKLKKGLHRLGVRCDARRTRGFPPKTVTAFLYWKSDDHAHWMVWHKGKYYDPAAGVFRKPPQHTIDGGARVTSYLKVYLD